MRGRYVVGAGAAALMSLAATPAIDPVDVRRGAEAVGERTSEQPALRAAAQPSASFRLGTAYRAWRNAAAAVQFDAANTTGDGGDAEALAIDCGDERIAFASLEAARLTTGAGEADIARAAGEADAGIGAAWRLRRLASPGVCH